MRKTTFLIGAALGYVLGARAGRRRYEQISALANRVWGTPQVQHAKETATAAASEAAKSTTINLREVALNSAPAASVKSAANRAASAVKDKLPGSSTSSSTSSPAVTTPVAPAATAPGTRYPSTPSPTPAPGAPLD